MKLSEAIKEIRMFVDLYNYGSEECKQTIQQIEDGLHDQTAAKPSAKPKVVSTDA